jgi:Flp pilus assembly protein TadG
MFSGGVHRRRGQRGAAALEFAFLAPFVLYLVLGVVTYGWILSFRQTLSQAAAEGARAAAVAPGGFTLAQQTSTAVNALNDSLGSYGLACDTVGNLLKGGATVGVCTVSVDPCANDASSKCVTVSLDYDYGLHPMIPLPGMNVVTPNHITYQAVALVSS